MKKIFTTIMMTSALTGMVFAASQKLTIKGSDTMVHLVSTWAENFMKENKETELSVTGGGSGTGIAAIINRTTDICASSRDIKDKEIKLAESKGIKLIEKTIAKDGIAVVVNPGNSVTELTIEQIGKIYTGAITNWKQVGGPDNKIGVLSRESSSGTYVFFQEHVLKMQDYTPKARLMPATSAIIQAVAEDKFSIGYVGLGYAEKAKDRIKVLNIRENADAKAVEPSEATVLDGTYGIARPLYLYVNGEPQGVIKKFLDYALSAEGQKVVKETGYVPVR